MAFCKALPRQPTPQVPGVTIPYAWGAGLPIAVDTVSGRSQQALRHGLMLSEGGTLNSESRISRRAMNGSS